jgi:cytochrome c oxidase assembly protein subunit 11
MSERLVTSPDGGDANRRNLRVAAYCLVFAAGMVGMSYAAVPLYQLFCKVTGFGGTTQRAERAPDAVAGEFVTVRFDANISPALKWSFEAVTREITLNIGQNELAFYRVKNLSDQPVTGTATFNVTPEITGSYFNKIQCFCFQEQRLEPGESMEMPVSFFVDPAILDDPDAKDMREITLSYTFFPLKGQNAQTAGKTSNTSNPGG